MLDPISLTVVYRATGQPAEVRFKPAADGAAYEMSIIRTILLIIKEMFDAEFDGAEVVGG